MPRSSSSFAAFSMSAMWLLRAHHDAHLRASSTSSSSSSCSTGVSGGAASETAVNSSVPLTPRPYRRRATRCRGAAACRRTRSRGGGVGAIARLTRGGAQAGHVQHAPAGRDDLAAALRRSRVEDLGPLDLVEAGDHVAARGRLRVAARGEHDGHRPVVGPLGLDAASPPGRAERSSSSSRSERSRGRTPVSRDRRSGRCTRAPSARRPRHHSRRRARRGRACRGGAARRRSAGAPLPRSRACCRRRHRAPASSAHAARVRPLVAVEDSLVVRRAPSGSPDASQRRTATAPRLRGTPRAPPRVAEAALAEEDLHRRACLALVLAMITPLPAASTSAFRTAG